MSSDMICPCGWTPAVSNEPGERSVCPKCGRALSAQRQDEGDLLELEAPPVHPDRPTEEELSQIDGAYSLTDGPPLATVIAESQEESAERMGRIPRRAARPPRFVVTPGVWKALALIVVGSALLLASFIFGVGRGGLRVAVGARRGGFLGMLMFGVLMVILGLFRLITALRGHED
jgi:hypothetical protein